MAGLIPQSFIDDLLNRTDILDVVGSRIQLKKTGKNYSACCPFHKEKTPSFTVSPDKQFYYCFGCGAGGNALGFVMDHDQLDFVQAVEDLAKRAGMDVPREEGRRGHKPRQPVDSPLYPLLAASAEFYRQALKSHPARKAAVEYLKGRGLTGEIARDFGLGFAPPGWDNLLKNLGGDNLQLKAMLDAGLLVENPDSGKRYDRFRDRVIFPIRDSRGRVIAFGGRVLGDDKPKYLNSPETPVFHKGQELYGLYEARKNNRDLDEIMVVEGYMDVIALAQQGIRNAVATLGTATSEEHIKRLFRIVPNILFCFDGDQAGRNAAWRALESALSNLQDGRKVRFLFLPEGEDPDSLVRAEGPDAFRARLAHQAQPLADYFFQQLTQEADPSTLEGKAHLATLAGPLLEKIPGNTLRLLMRQRLGEITGLSAEALSQISAPRSGLSGQGSHAAKPAVADSSAHEYADYDMGQFAEHGDSHYQDASNYFEAPADFSAGHQGGAKPGKKSWKGDRKWDGKGKKGDFVPRQPRTEIHVESPTLTALRTLLHYPQMAQKVEDASHFSNEGQTNSQLLVALVEALQKNPKQRSMHLIARWHGTPQGRLLQVLAEKEWLIGQDNLEKQFVDTITTLAHNQLHSSREARLRSVLQKSPSELTDEEKALLREHISSPSSPGAQS
ncbi:DNA primase [Pseudomonas nitritireducens]|uniref:DNA primase n=1 Tax=Pseudomonas nitroreducens TaxID=46680 RepID=A0A7W7KR09_PSENT|nr:DNA primase [Pseudomonas nitritireducens]MBB4867387.1 DNA primase [Pseudomonas nitritireducens]